MSFLNRSIGRRLYAGFGLVVSLCALLGFVAWSQIQRIGTIVTEINDSWVVSIVQLNQINDALSEIRRSELRYVTETTATAHDAQDAIRVEQLRKIGVATKPYEATGISGPPEQKIYDDYLARYRAYLDSWQTLRPLARSGDEQRAKAIAYLNGPSKAAFEAANEALQTDIDFNVQGAQVMKVKAKDALETGVWMVAATLAAIVGVSFAFARQVTRSIVVPLQSAIGVASTIARGDLSRSVGPSRVDETGQLLSALADMQTSLRGTITGIQQSADQVGTASAQIATGNSDLSARTERQASSLQETAASIEQLTTTVSQTADNARQADELAVTVTRLAEQGGSVVGRVVDTMSGISQSSQRIGDIISVIDGIAFQTNILALNAAVEAARAGEQGRGFAVVASEVRTLAQRSAQAAKEIKTLIQESVERVDSGGQLVQQAGATMSGIVDSIRSLTELISRVSGAASEQNSGIRVVNGAVTDLDKSTQQNAALVEESAAAAESLKAQAFELAQAVGKFKLAGA